MEEQGGDRYGASRSRLRIDNGLSIGEDELAESFVRASGPGGQNVNKVSTAVQLRFDVRASASLPEDVKQRLVGLAGRRMTRDGVLRIDVQRFRSQDRNRTEARAQLIALIVEATTKPAHRRKTRPPHGSTLDRLDDKQRRALTKRHRRVIGPQD